MHALRHVKGFLDFTDNKDPGEHLLQVLPGDWLCRVPNGAVWSHHRLRSQVEGVVATFSTLRTKETHRGRQSQDISGCTYLNVKCFSLPTQALIKQQFSVWGEEGGILCVDNVSATDTWFIQLKLKREAIINQLCVRTRWFFRWPLTCRSYPKFFFFIKMNVHQMRQTKDYHLGPPTITFYVTFLDALFR